MSSLRLRSIRNAIIRGTLIAVAPKWHTEIPESSSKSDVQSRQIDVLILRGDAIKITRLSNRLHTTIIVPENP